MGWRDGVEAVIPPAALRNGLCVKLDNLFYVYYVRVTSNELDAICAGANNVLTSERRNWFRAEFLRRAFDFTHKQFIYEPPLHSDEMAQAKIYAIEQIIDEKLSGSYFLSALRQMPAAKLVHHKQTATSKSEQQTKSDLVEDFVSLKF